MGQLSRKDGEVKRVVNLFLGGKKKRRKKLKTLKPQEKATKMFSMIKQWLFIDENKFLTPEQVLFSSWKKRRLWMT